MQFFKHFSPQVYNLYALIKHILVFASVRKKLKLNLCGNKVAIRYIYCLCKFLEDFKKDSILLTEHPFAPYLCKWESCTPCVFLDNNWLPWAKLSTALCPTPCSTAFVCPSCALDSALSICSILLCIFSCTTTPCALCSTVSQRLGSFIYILCHCALPCPCSGHCIYVSVYLNQLPDWHSLHTFRHETLPRSCPECQSQTLIKFCEAE